MLVKLNKSADNDSTKTLNFKHVYSIQKQKRVLNELSHTIQNGKANDSKAIFQNSFCIHRASFDKSSDYGCGIS